MCCQDDLSNCVLCCSDMLYGFCRLFIIDPGATVVWFCCGNSWNRSSITLFIGPRWEINASLSPAFWLLLCSSGGSKRVDRHFEVHTPSQKGWETFWGSCSFWCSFCFRYCFLLPISSQFPIIWLYFIVVFLFLVPFFFIID